MMFWTWLATNMKEGRMKTQEGTSQNKHSKNYNWTTVWKTTYFNLGKNKTKQKISQLKTKHGGTFCSSNVWNVSSGFWHWAGFAVTTVKWTQPALPHRVTWVTVQCLFFFIQSHFSKCRQKISTSSISAVQEVWFLNRMVYFLKWTPQTSLHHSGW